MRLKFNSLFIMLTLALLLTVTGCGGASRAGDAAPVQEAVPTQAAAAPTAAEPAQPEAAESPAAEKPAPATGAALSFELSGGIVGFCDTLTMTAAGEYRLQSCGKDDQTGALPEQDVKLLETWHTGLAAFTLSNEDNPGGPDNLSSKLVFNGIGPKTADEIQQQIINDWVNGLLIRVRPQPVAAPPTPAPPVIGPNGLCPDIERPAMLIANYDNPSSLILKNKAGPQCDIALPQPPFGRIAAAAGAIFYPAFDAEAKTVTVWQLKSSGEQVALDFTQVDMEEFGPYNFVVSADGQKIAWARTIINFETDPPVYSNSLWLANLDGSELLTLIDQAQNDSQRYVQPVKMLPDGSGLYYALQPDTLTGTIFSFGGRYDTLYRAAAAGGESQLLFDCASEGLEMCVGSVSADGQLLAYTDTGAGQVKIVAVAGSPVATITPPETGYIGPAIFGPDGKLAFITAVLTEADEQGLQKPNPGTLNALSAPYAGPPETWLTGNSVAAVWEWLDDARLAFGEMGEQGDIGTTLITADGVTTELSPNFPLAVLR
jgi:hypothetical protein